MIRLAGASGLLALILSAPGLALSGSTGDDPLFAIRLQTSPQGRSNPQDRVFRRSELLSRKDLTSVRVQSDPAYSGTSRVYRAVPVWALFEGVQIEPGVSLVFQCQDGFSAPIDLERVLNRSKGKSIAYLAIEDPENRWPALNSKKGDQSAGPFYVIWDQPELSRIGQEEWPFQVISFEVKKTLESLYPKIFPAAPHSKEVSRGFQVFLKNCFPCHTMNLQGGSTIGPDLNQPMNPTEYFKPKALKMLIRNPRSVLSWPDQRMKPRSKQEISDSELDDLISYLAHMKTKSK